MYSGEILESMKKVEAARAKNVQLEPRRMTAEEKDTLLATYHPDYKQDQGRKGPDGVGSTFAGE